MLEHELVFTKFRNRLRNEAVKKFDELETNFKLLYTTQQCQMCGAHLTVRQMNRVILQGAPPVCTKDYKIMKGQVEELSKLFGQMRLF